MIVHVHRRIHSFRYALRGIGWVIRHHHNFLIHLFISACVIILACRVRVKPIEFVVLLIVILVGLVTEMLNTALEEVTDLVSHEWRVEAQRAKDIGAGAMLLVAIVSISIAAIIFYQYFGVAY